MIWVFVFSIIFVALGAIAYPLFYGRLLKYTTNYSSNINFNRTNFWLSALSDLDDDFTLGRISKIDYQKQKLILQRSYLDSIEK